MWRFGNIPLKGICLLIAGLVSFCAWAQDPVPIEDQFPKAYYSLPEHAIIFEDPVHQFKFSDLLDSAKFNQMGWKSMEAPSPNLGFTQSSFWVQIKIDHKSHLDKHYFLEVARPLTNVVDLYVTDSDGLTVVKHNGDELPFSGRTVQNRKLLFPVSLHAEDLYIITLHLRSDGEVINLPIRLWEKDGFLDYYSRENYFFGLYYGILAFVILVFLFFYRMLKERAYLDYSLYVVSMLFLQLSLDGLAYQFLWPEWVWWGNHSVLVLGSVSVYFVLRYVRQFMRLSDNLPGLVRVFRGLETLSLLNMVLSFTPLPLYAIAFPMVNAVSLLSTIFILVTIFIALRRKIPVNRYFVAAFAILLASAIFFILGNFSIVYHHIWTEHSLKIGSAIEVVLLSLSMAGRYRDIQQEKELAQQELLVQLEEKNRLKDEINIRLEKQVTLRTAELNESNLALAARNKDITDSIRYAYRIQKAILPSPQKIKSNLPGSFVVYQPKDIVSGDFYFLEKSIGSGGPAEKTVLFAAVDCTGHGVPGAFMSIVGQNGLYRAVNELGMVQPGRILDHLHQTVSQTLRQQRAGTASDVVKDGMDIALCSWQESTKKLEFSGAFNPLYLVRNGELSEIKGNKQPIGLSALENTPFTNHELELKSGDAIYIFSDGFADQFGGPKGKKYKYNKFKQFLVAIHQLPAQEQKQKLIKEFEYWKGEEEQVDDVCIFGMVVS